MQANISDMTEAKQKSAYQILCVTIYIGTSIYRYPSSLLSSTEARFSSFAKLFSPMSYLAAARKGQLYPSRHRPPGVYRPPATPFFDYTAFFHAKPPIAKPKIMTSWRKPLMTSKELPNDDARRLRSIDLRCALMKPPTPMIAPKTEQTQKVSKSKPKALRATLRATRRRATSPPSGTSVSSWFMVVWMLMAVRLLTGCAQMATSFFK
jgi:hypothetical protein